MNLMFEWHSKKCKPGKINENDSADRITYSLDFPSIIQYNMDERKKTG